MTELSQTLRLFKLLPRRPNELWQIDMTYIHLQFQWCYVTAVIYYYSLYLLACHLTSTQNTTSEIEGLTIAQVEAATYYDQLPAKTRLVPDNGSCFFSHQSASHIEDQFEHERNRCHTPEQLGLLELFHRNLKQEEVPWREYLNTSHARVRLSTFQDRYNGLRPHWALRPAAYESPLTASDVYLGKRSNITPAWQGWVKASHRKLMDAGYFESETEQAQVA